jgi:hypothetical protein
MDKMKEILINILKQIRNLLYILGFLGLLGAIFYYFRVQKIHVFTGEWHWNLFEYYGMNYEKKYFIVFGILFVIFMFLANKANLFNKEK